MQQTRVETVSPSATVLDMDLGRVGAWWSGSWTVANEPDLDAGAAMEALGYRTLWSSGGFDPGLSPRFERLLSGTTTAGVASGIVSIWATTPEELAPPVAELEARYPGRFTLGIGTSHSVIVQDYTKPYSKMVEFLDRLDAAENPIPPERRVLAALGPRMLELSAGRAAGAHPYFVPVEHTAMAREILGPDPILAPEVAVVLEPDATRARELARGYAATYLSLPNYTENLRGFKYNDDDIEHGGSDRLIDAVIPWGDVDQIAARLAEHFDAGANHVCVQAISDHLEFPLEQFRALAPALAAL